MNESLEEQLKAIYSEGNNHLREQTTKRDQVLAAYFILISFYITNLTTLKEFDSSLSLYNGLGIMIFFIGIIVCFVIVEFRVWHQIYLDALKITTYLLTHKENYQTVYDVKATIDNYYSSFKKEKFNYSKFFSGSDNKIMTALFFIVGTTIYFFNGIMRLVQAKYDSLLVIGSGLLFLLLFILQYAWRLKKARSRTPWILWGITTVFNEGLNNPYFEVKELSKAKIFLKQKTGGVILVPKYQDKFLLINIIRNGQEFLEFPRGFSEKNEPLIEAARREINEEIGIQVTRNQITNLGKLMTDSGLIEDNIECFEVILQNLDNVSLQSSEQIIGYKLLTSKKISKLINEKKIIDNFTIAGFTLSISKQKMN